MTKWRYHITVHEAGDVLPLLEEPVQEIPPTIFCDDEGSCYFDPGSSPLVQALERLLDSRGEEGWELVQVAFRPAQMIAFWKQPR